MLENLKASITLVEWPQLIKKEIKKSNNSTLNLSKNHRADIIDLNGQIIAKTLLRSVVGIKPNLIIDENKLLLNQILSN